MSPNISLAEQYRTLDRLCRAGCPVNIANLPAPLLPLRVSSRSDEPVLGIFPMGNNTGIAAQVEIVARNPITIVKKSLRAPWLETEASLLGGCAKHQGSYCFHEYPSGKGHLHFREDLVLPHSAQWVLARGARLKGLLLAILPSAFPLGLGGKQQVTFVCEDLSGHEHPFRLWLEIRASAPAVEIAQSTSSD